MNKFKLSLIIFFIFLLIAYLFGDTKKEKLDVVSVYKQNYFISGDKEDAIKFQVSVKYNMLYPTKWGLYSGYTMIAWWAIYDRSAPFKEYNHNPEIFWRFVSGDNFLNDKVLPGYVDYLQVGLVEHKSNGRNGEDSRSMNRSYLQGQFSYGTKYNIGLNLKVWKLYAVASDNEDIDNYIGIYRGEIFFKLLSKTVDELEKERIYVAWGHGNNFKYGWMEAGLQTRIFTTKVQPRFFVQCWYGYNEFLIRYNKKDFKIRGGVLFK